MIDFYVQLKVCSGLSQENELLQLFHEIRCGEEFANDIDHLHVARCALRAKSRSHDI